MATIRFLASGVDTTIIVPATPGAPRTLLSIAKERAIPILFNCESGHCGACVVHVETRSNGHRPFGRLTEKEKFLLKLMSMLTEEEIEAAERQHVPPEVRLACQYSLQDEDIVVYFESELGGS